MLAEVGSIPCGFIHLSYYSNPCRILVFISLVKTREACLACVSLVLWLIFLILEGKIIS